MYMCYVVLTAAFWTYLSNIPPNPRCPYSIRSGPAPPSLPALASYNLCSSNTSTLGEGRRNGGVQLTQLKSLKCDMSCVYCPHVFRHVLLHCSSMLRSSAPSPDSSSSPTWFSSLSWTRCVAMVLHHPMFLHVIGFHNYYLFGDRSSSLSALSLSLSLYLYLSIDLYISKTKEQDK